MNEIRKPTLNELSNYYDGLLDGEDKRRVETYLETHHDSKQILELFDVFDHCSDIEIPEERIDMILSGNLTEIHERLIREERRERKGHVSWLSWFFMPQNLLAGLAALLVLFGTALFFEQSFNAGDQGVEIAQGTTPKGPDDSGPTGDPTTEHIETSVPTLSDAQKTTYIALIELTKTAVSNGYEFAKEQTKPLEQNITSMSKAADLSNGLGMIKPAETTSDNSTLADARKSLAIAGTQQIAIGLGASVISMISVF